MDISSVTQMGSHIPPKVESCGGVSIGSEKGKLLSYGEKDKIILLFKIH